MKRTLFHRTKRAPKVVTLLITGMLSCMQVHAEDLLIEDSTWEDPAGQIPENDPLGTGLVVQNESQGTGAADQNAAAEDDGAALIEDGGSRNISVQEGELFDDVIREEEEARARELAEERMKQLLEDEIWLPANASVEMLTEYYNQLTDMASPTGSDGELLMSRYIQQTMDELGYDTQLQYFHEGILNEQLVDPQGINIIAGRGANTENHTDQILIIAAHYDSVTEPAEGDPLANDKTGAALLMETARLLKDAKTDVDLCFLFLSGEEDGGYGAKAFAEGLQEELRNRICGIVLIDQTGYVKLDDPNSHPVYQLQTPEKEVTAVSAMLRMMAMIREEARLIYADLFQEEMDGPDDNGIDDAVEELTEADTETEETVPEETDWMYSELTAGGAMYLTDICKDLVTVAQKIPEKEDDAKAADGETEEPLEKADPAAVTETETTAENPDGTAEMIDDDRPHMRQLVPDMTALARCVDLVAETAAMYMQSADPSQL